VDIHQQSWQHGDDGDAPIMNIHRESQSGPIMVDATHQQSSIENW
jgi:hypothetical protein